MIQIKFRAWDIDNKRMTEGYSLEDIIKGYQKYPVNKIEDDNLIWLQFTGLQDRNSKDIYEGDILQNDNYFNCVTSSNGKIDEHPDKRIVDWIGDELCFGWKYLDSGMEGRPSGLCLRKKAAHECFEIIGNIYENKDLLNQ